MAEPVKKSEIHEQDEAGLDHSKFKQAQAVFKPLTRSQPAGSAIQKLIRRPGACTSVFS